MKRKLAVGITIGLASVMMATPAFATQSVPLGVIGGISSAVEEKVDTTEEKKASGLFGQETQKDVIAGIQKGEEVAEEAVKDIKGDIVALDDIGISVVADDYVSIAQDDGFVYIYKEDDDSIPYVIIGRYDFEADDFVDQFTDYMTGVYPDLDVNMLREGIDIGDHVFDVVEYNYQIAGFDARDVRMFTGQDGCTYMFGSKEIDEIDSVLPEDYLTNVAASFELLAGGADDYELHVNADMGVADTGLKLDNTDDIDIAEDDKVIFTESMAPYDGVWEQFEDGFQLFLPADWLRYDPTDIAKEAGCFYQAGSPDAQYKKTAPYINVNIGEVDGVYETLEDLAEDMRAEDYEASLITDINGIECLCYSYYEEDVIDMAGIVFFYPDRDDLMLSVVAYNYSENSDILSSVLCSLSPLEK